MADVTVISKYDNYSKTNLSAILIHGTITRNDISKLTKALSKGIIDVYLNSPGGDVDSALTMGDLIYKSFGYADVISGFDGHVIKAKNPVTVRVSDSANGICASACVFILASARNRIIYPENSGRSILVHSPYSLNINEDIDTIENNFKSIKMRANNQFERAGVSGQLWNIMTSVTSERTRTLTKSEEDDLALNGAQPALVDYQDGILAQMHGLTKSELLSRMNLFKQCHASHNNSPDFWNYCLAQAGIPNKPKSSRKK